jgi:hypothetical protein
MRIVTNKEEFNRKYVQVYPTHMNFEEKFTVREKRGDGDLISYFFRIPSYRKRITKTYTIS